jgi:hypothetical protein
MTDLSGVGVVCQMQDPGLSGTRQAAGRLNCRLTKTLYGRDDELSDLLPTLSAV